MDPRSKFYSFWDSFVFLILMGLATFISLQRVISPQRTAHALGTQYETSPSFGTRFAKKIDLGCLLPGKFKKHYASNEGALRIRGRLCVNPWTSHDRNRGIRNLQVTNLTSGKISPTFQAARDSFASDTIALKEGKNVIEVAWREGKSEQPLKAWIEVFQR